MKGRARRKAAPEKALPYYDKDELFATAHLEVDRVTTGEHLIPSELMERGLKDKRLLFAWHGLLRKQQDTLQNKSLSRQVASMKARQMLLRPDDSDLTDAEALLDKPIEARVSDMTARLRRKFEDMKVIEPAKARAGRKQSSLMLDLDWEDQVDVEGIEELDEDVEDDIHSGKRGQEVADKLHREEELLRRKETMMKERDAKTTGNLEQEGNRILRRQHTLRDMEGTVQASSGVAPAADTSHNKMGGGLMVETLPDSPKPGGVANGVVPTEGSWARVIDMHLAADGFTERYIPGCGRRRCAMHLGLADEVVEDEHRGHTNTGLGLRWKEVGWFRPHEGRQVFNILLIEALQLKREFTPAELARFGIVDLSHSDFVRGADLKYYRPVAVPKARGNLSVDTALCSRQEEEDTMSMMPFVSPAQRPSTVSGELGRKGFLTPSGSPLSGANTDRPSTSDGPGSQLQMVRRQSFARSAYLGDKKASAGQRAELEHLVYASTTRKEPSNASRVADSCPAPHKPASLCLRPKVPTALSIGSSKDTLARHKLRTAMIKAISTAKIMPTSPTIREEG